MRDMIHPSEHIDIDVATERASPAEIWIARELNWLLTTDSKFPTGERITDATQSALVRRFPARSGAGFEHNAVTQELQGRISPDAAARLRLDLSTEPLGNFIKNTFKRSGSNAHFPNFSLLSFLLGMTFAELFEKASERELSLQVAA